MEHWDQIYKYGIFFALLIIPILIKTIPKRKKAKRKERIYTQSKSEYLPTKAEFKKDEALPYKLESNILTPTELNFYNVLKTLVGSKGIVQCKVRLGDIFQTTAWEYKYRNKVNQKHIDFLICNTETMKPIIGIELDDPSHNRKDRQERDDFVDSVFKACNLPILHVTVQRKYDLEELTRDIKKALKS